MFPLKLARETSEGGNMPDIIINAALGIVATTDCLIARVRREALNDPTVQTELDLLRDALYLLEDAVNILRRACENRPELARGLIHATLQ